MAKLVDEPKDILALFGGIVITSALILVVFADMVFKTGYGEVALGALIPTAALIYQHFFQKNNTPPPQE